MPPLEALACGTPVIATDICAQPEIVEDEQSGYLLPIEKDSEVGKWRYLSQRHDTAYQSIYEQTIVSLATSLAEVVRRCWENLSGYEALSDAALHRVRSRFAHDDARNELERVSESCRS